jgi:hypothetical protein
LKNFARIFVAAAVFLSAPLLKAQDDAPKDAEDARILPWSPGFQEALSVLAKIKSLTNMIFHCPRTKMVTPL